MFTETLKRRAFELISLPLIHSNLVLASELKFAEGPYSSGDDEDDESYSTTPDPSDYLELQKILGFAMADTETTKSIDAFLNDISNAITKIQSLKEKLSYHGYKPIPELELELDDSGLPTDKDILFQLPDRMEDFFPNQKDIQTNLQAVQSLRSHTNDLLFLLSKLYFINYYVCAHFKIPNTANVIANKIYQMWNPRKINLHIDDKYASVDTKRNIEKFAEIIKAPFAFLPEQQPENLSTKKSIDYYVEALHQCHFISINMLLDDQGIHIFDPNRLDDYSAFFQEENASFWVRLAYNIYNQIREKQLQTFQALLPTLDNDDIQLPPPLDTESLAQKDPKELQSLFHTAVL